MLNALITRCRERSRPDSFRCRVRLRSGYLHGIDEKWRTGRAHWVHDVLLIHRGTALLRIVALPVLALEEQRPVSSRELRRMGKSPLVAATLLDDGTLIELAVRAEDGATARGPFEDATVADPAG